MPQASFIAQQIADFRDRTTFVPFLISVVDGSQWYVGRPHMLTLLAEGILLCEDDFTEIVIPF